MGEPTVTKIAEFDEYLRALRVVAKYLKADQELIDTVVDSLSGLKDDQSKRPHMTTVIFSDTEGHIRPIVNE